MAFANNSFSEAAFASESAGITNVVPTGFGLTTNLNSVTIAGTIGVDVPVTGFDLTVNNTTEVQDTLFAFAEAPFATQSPSTFSPPNVTVGIVSNAAVTGIAMTTNLGTATTTANADVIPTGLPLTVSLGTAVGFGLTTAAVTGLPMTATLGTVLPSTDVVTEDVTGVAMTMAQGVVFPDPNSLIIPTGIAMTMNEGTATTTADANSTPTGIAMSASLGSVGITLNTPVDITGNQLTMQEGTATATDSLAILTGIQMTMGLGSVVGPIIWNPVPTGNAPLDPPGWKEVA